jgi:hypothetical protein
MVKIAEPSPVCCEHAAQVAELTERLAEVQRLLLAAAGRLFDPLPGDPASGARLRAVS